MPVEIRELVIRTEVTSREPDRRDGHGKAELKQLKRQLLAECRKLLQARHARKPVAR
ncbi:MAG TPA: DUF5908 family protein [Candidatus Acidoferrum sp.]|nr:DUF5908 family protein [Candidatus Acidoferrum sp.]